jgi:hypothetical protein
MSAEQMVRGCAKELQPRESVKEVNEATIATEKVIAVQMSLRIFGLVSECIATAITGPATESIRSST